MRLSRPQKTVIRETLLRHFGQRSRIRLFGSRVDDTARGGDIDLYVQPEIQDADALTEARLRALRDLHRVLGEQKIDLVIHREQSPELPIHRIAQETGLPL